MGKKNQRPESLEDAVLKVMERKYTPRRAVALGFALIPLGSGLMLLNVYPSYLVGLSFVLLGVFSVVVGVLDWLSRELPWLRSFLKKAVEDIWNGT